MLVEINWAPQKGKAFDKLPAKTLKIFDSTMYLVSTKYDGNQIFIVKDKNKIRWFTSDWKEFNLPIIAEDLKKYPHNFVIVAEMNYDAIGKLGDRTKVQGKITTARTRFKKGLDNGIDESKVCIKCFDYLAKCTDGVGYEDRMSLLDSMGRSFISQLQVVKLQLMSGRRAKKHAKVLAQNGWEGCMAVEPGSLYHFGKRVNHSIKLKDRPTVDVLCIGVKYSEINPEDIGSVIVRDNEGRECAAGGLSDELKAKDPEYFIGKIIEISYEQIMDTYQQPQFECIRDDKKDSE